MTDNDLKTRPVPHQADTAGRPTSYEVAGGAPPPPAGFPPVDDDRPRRSSWMDRIRTPMAATIGGGILVLGVGFGAGYAVGHHFGGGAAQQVEMGPDGQTGQMGQFPGGQGMPGQMGQGQTGQDPGQTGQDPGQTGQGQTGDATGADTALTT